MKIALSGLNTSKNVLNLTNNQMRYVVSRSKNPQVMQKFLMGNWLTSAFSKAANAVKSVTGLTASSSIQNAINKGNTTPSYSQLKNAFPQQPTNLTPKIAPKTTTIPELNKIEIQNTIDNVIENQKIEDIKAIESVKLYEETQKLLQKQAEEEKAKLLFDNFIKDQLQQIDTSKPTSSFDFSKIVPYLAIAATIPFLLSGEK